MLMQSVTDMFTHWSEECLAVCVPLGRLLDWVAVFVSAARHALIHGDLKAFGTVTDGGPGCNVIHPCPLGLFPQEEPTLPNLRECNVSAVLDVG